MPRLNIAFPWRRSWLSKKNFTVLKPQQGRAVFPPVGAVVRKSWGLPLPSWTTAANRSNGYIHRDGAINTVYGYPGYCHANAENATTVTAECSSDLAAVGADFGLWCMMLKLREFLRGNKASLFGCMLTALLAAGPTYAAPRLSISDANHDNMEIDEVRTLDANDCTVTDPTDNKLEAVTLEIKSDDPTIAIGEVEKVIEVEDGDDNYYNCIIKITALQNGSTTLQVTAIEGNSVTNPFPMTVKVSPSGGSIIVEEETIPTISETSTTDARVKLSKKPRRDVTVSFDSKDKEVVSVDQPKLVFTPENYDTSQTMRIRGLVDDDNEDDTTDVTLIASGGGYTDVEKSLSVTVKERPGAPRNPFIRPGYRQAILSWEAPNVGGTPVKWQYAWRRVGFSLFGDLVDMKCGDNLCPADTTEYVFTRPGAFVNGKTYSFLVAAVDEYGGVGPALEFTAKFTFKPTRFTVAAGNKQAMLSWDTLPESGGWQYRQKEGSEDYGDWTDIAGSGSATNSHVVTGLTAGSAYTFQIRAKKPNGDFGAGSDELVVTPVTGLAPSFETASVADQTYKQNIEIEALVLPAATGGDGTLSYTLTPTLPAGLSLDTTTRTISGKPSAKQDATTYTWTAADTNGDKATVEFEIVVEATLASPTGLKATPGDGEVVLNWDPHPDLDHSGDGYFLQFAKGEDLPSGGRYLGKTTFYTVEDLDNGHQYVFGLVAFDSQAGELSLPTVVFATPQATPEKPTGVVATPSNSRVRLSWDAVNFASTDGVYWQYRYKSGSSAFPENWTDAQGSDHITTQYDVTGLTNGIAYDFQVRAVRGVAYGEASDAVSATPGEIKPAAPTGLTAVAGEGSVSLSWTPPTNTILDKQQVRWKATHLLPFTDSDSWTDLTDSSATEHMATGLTNGISYRFQVRAVSVDGEGEVASVSAFPTTVAPGKPSGLAAVAGDGTVSLSWLAIETATGWQYQQKEGDGEFGAWTTIASSDATTTSHELTELINGTTYSFRVRAVRSGASGAPSDPVEATPAAVLTPMGFFASQSQAMPDVVDLRWTSAANPAITKWQYQVAEDDDPFGSAWTDIPNSGATTRAYSVSDLAIGTKYQFRVRAVVGSTPQDASDADDVTPWILDGWINLKSDDCNLDDREPSWPNNPGDRTMSRDSSPVEFPIVLFGDDCRPVRGQVVGNPPRVFTGWKLEVLSKIGVIDLDIPGHGFDNIDDRGQEFRAKDLDYQYGPLRLRVSPTAKGGTSVVRVRITDEDSGGDGGNITNHIAAFDVMVAANPLFSADAEIADQHYAKGGAISPPTLPAATGGNGKLTYTVFPALPAGLVFDGNGTDDLGLNSGVPPTLSGTPTAIQSWTTHTITVHDDDTDTSDADSDSISFRLRVNVPPTVDEAVDDQTVVVGKTKEINLSNVFIDANEDDKDLQVTVAFNDTIKKPSFSAQASSPFTMKRNGNTLELTGVSAGSDTVTLYTTDLGGATASDSFTVTSVATPSPVTGLTAKPGDGEVTLSWVLPESGSTATGAEVRYKEKEEVVEEAAKGAAVASSTTWTDWADAAGNTSHTITGLSNGVGYTFEVRATNAVGGSDAESVDASPLAKPAKPDLAAAPGDGKVTLSWTDPGNSSITGYQVQQKEGDAEYGVWGGIDGSGASTTSHEVAGLTNETTYSFKIRAVNTSGEGVASDEVSVRPVPAGLTLSVASLKVTEGSTGTFTVKLATKPSADVTVTPSSNAEGVATVSGVMTFTASNWNTKQTVTVMGMEDNDGADDSAMVMLEVSSSDADYGADENEVVSVIVNDNTSPSVVITTDKDSLGKGETATVTVTFSEAVTGFTSDELTTNGGALTAFSGSGATYTATLTPPDDATGSITLSVAAGVAVDDASNDNTAADDKVVNYNTDNTSPSVVITTDKDSLGKGETATVTVTFSEAVTGFVESELVASDGQLTAFSGSGTTYTATLTPPDDATGSITLSVAAGVAVDDASNDNTAADDKVVNYNTDNTSPSVVITTDKDSLGKGETATVTVTFSEAVTGFVESELVASGGQLTAFSGSGATYTATLTPPDDATGSITLSVAAGVAVDDASNDNTAADDKVVNYNTDNTSPSVVITTDKDSLGKGETATVTVTFSEAVTGFTSDELTTNGGALTAFSGSGTTYTATLTPPDDATGSITLSVAAGVAVDDASNDNTAADDKVVNYNTDNTSPSVVITTDKDSLGKGETATVTVTFSEAVTGFTSDELTTNGGALTAFSGSGTTYTATLTPPDDATGSITLSVAAAVAVDDASNDNTAADDKVVNYNTDNTSPSVVITTDKDSLGKGETATVTVTFSEAVTGFTSDELTTNGGALTAFSGSGTTYTATLTPPDDATGSITLSVAAAVAVDDASNDNTAADDKVVNYNTDNTSPSVVITTDKDSLGKGETATVTVTFSEAVTGFTSDELTTNGGALTAFSGSGATYTATLTPPDDATGSITLSVAAAVAVDDASNDNTAADDKVVNYNTDNTSPSVVITTDKDSLGKGETATVTVTFSEAVTGFTSDELTTNGGALTAFSGSGATYTATLTPPDDATGSITLSVAAAVAVDVASNDNTAADDKVVNYNTDNTSPSVVIATDKDSLGKGETATVTVTFSEAVTGFVESELVASDGQLTAFSGSGTTYTATLTPPDDATGSITLGVAAAVAVDVASNDNTAADDKVINYNTDNTSPSVVITTDKDSLGKGETATVTVTFSEAVTGFTSDELTTNGGALTAFSGSGATYTATLTPPDDATGSITLSVAAAVAVDVASNDNTAADDKVVNYNTDNTSPSVVITTDKDSLGKGETATVTVTFSEAVTGFTSDELTTNGGALTAFSGSGATYTATLTPPDDATGSITLSVAAGVAVDDASNDNTAADDKVVNYNTDNTSPSVVITTDKDSLGKGETATVTVTFSEAVTGFTSDELTTNGGALTAFSGSGATYTATLTPPDDATGSITLSVAAAVAVDDASNDNTAADDKVVNYNTDNTSPSVVITTDKDSLGKGETATVTVTFSEAVTGFVESELVASDGQLTAFSGSGATYTATLTPPDDATGSITLSVAAAVAVDDASNDNTAADDKVVNYNTDNTSPSVVITTDKDSLGKGETATVTVTFSEAVTGFTSDELTTNGGALTAFSGSGTTYTATLTPPDDATGSITLSVAAGVAVDDASNDNTAADDKVVNYNTDNTSPSVVITTDKDSLGKGETATVTVTFSEAVTGFVESELVASDGQLTAFSGSGTTYTATLTPPDDATGSITLSVAAAVAVDDASNDNTAADDKVVNYNTDNTSPSVVITTDKDSLGKGETATVTVTFSEAVTGFVESELVASGGQLTAFSGSGATYTATLTPPDDATGSITLSVAAGVAVDDASNDNTAADDKVVNYNTDNTSPSVVITTDKDSLGKGETATVTVTFSEAVTGFTSDELTTNGGALTAFSGSGTTYTATLTPPDDATGSITLSVAAAVAVDDASNDNTAADDKVVNYNTDNTSPSVVITTDKDSLGKEETATVTVTFSEAVTGFTSDELTTNGGALTAFSGSGATYTATLTPPDDATGSITLSVAAGVAVDDASNDNTAADDKVVNYNTDNTSPSVVITTDKDSLGKGETATVTVTFSEAVTGFVESELVASDGQLTAFSGSGATYTATLTPPDDATGSITLSVAAAVAVDDASNDNTAADDKVVNYNTDNTSPSVVITTDKDSLGKGETATVTVTFSEAVTGFTSDELTTNGGALTAFSGSGATYTATLTPPDDATGSITLSVAAAVAVDDASNDNTAADDKVVNYNTDNTSPSVVITTDKDSLGKGETATVTVTFSEAVTGFTSDELTTNGGALTAFSGSGATYTATLTPPDDATGSITLSVAAAVAVDDASNDNTAADDKVVNYNTDNTSPSVVITTDKDSLGKGETATVTVTFSEAVTGFVESELVASDGQLTAFSGSGATYTATLTPPDDATGSITLSVAAAVAVDDASNDNTAADDKVVNYNTDNTSPSVVITTDKDSLGKGETATVTVTFSEAVTGFTSDELTTNGGALTAFSGSGATYTATLTPPDDATGSITLSVAAGVAVDDASNDNTAADDKVVNYNTDNTSPSVVITTDKDSLGKGETATVTVTFSEAVTGFTSDELTTNGGALTAFSGSGATYTATLTPPDDATGSITLSVAAAVAVDDASNDNTAADDKVVNYNTDNTSPSVVITTDKDSLGKGETATVTVTFSEAVTGFVESELVASDGQLTAFSGSGTTYTATLTPPDDATGSITLSVAAAVAVDDASNDNTAADDKVVNYNTDNTSPSVVITTDKDSLGKGETATVTVTFSEAVTGFVESELVASDGQLTAFSGSGTTYTATLTPPDDATGSITLSVAAGVAVDDASNDNTAADDKVVNYNTDNTSPSVVITTDKDSLGKGETATVTVTFSEAVTGFTSDELTTNGGALTAFSGSGATYTATLTPPDDATGSITLSVAAAVAVDDASNDNTAADDKVVNYNTDNTSPSVVITTDKDSLGKEETATVTVTFSEAVTGFTSDELTTNGGALTAFSGSGATYTATLTPPDDATGSITLSVAAGVAVDDASNDNTAADDKVVNYNTDNTSPSVVITTDKDSLGKGETATVTVTFSEAVTGFTSDELTTNGGALTAFSGSGATYTATLTPPDDATGSITLSVAAGVAVDDASNDNTAADDKVVNYNTDNTSPSVVITTDKDSLGKGETATVTVTFSEAVTGFTSDELTTNGGALTAFSGSGATYTATLTPPDDATGSITLSVAAAVAVDDASNDNTAADDKVVNYNTDNTSPSVVITTDKDSLGKGETATVTVTFSEAVTGFVESELVASDGQLTAFSGSGATYTATLTPPDDATGSITLSVAAAVAVDDASNDNTAADDKVVNYNTDNTSPSVVITTDKDSLGKGETATVTVTFSEAVTGFTSDELTTNGGALTAFSGSGATYTATLTPPDDATGSITLSVAAAVAVDDASNDNTAADDKVVNYNTDNTSPSVVITTDKDSLGKGETATVTVTFSEAVTGFTSDELTTNGGALTAFSGSGATYTATLTPPDDATGSITLSVAAAVAVDDASNDNTAADDKVVNYNTDNTSPSVVITTDKDSLGKGETATVTVTFSEAVTGFTSDELTTNGGALTAFSGSGATYTATLTPPDDATGSITLSVAAAVAVDDASNDNTAADDKVVNYNTDNTSPSVVITTDKDSLGKGETATVTVTFSEAVTGFTSDELTTNGGALTAFSGSGATYTATLTPPDDATGSITLSVAAGVAVDDASNDNTAADDKVVNYNTDNTSPSVVITTDKDSLGKGETATVTVTFSEAVTGFVESELVASGGQLTAFSGSGTTYTATLTPPDDATGSITLSVAAGVAVDDASNDNTAADDKVVNYNTDNTSPSVVITTDKDSLGKGETATVTVTFSEAVTGFTSDELTTNGGALTAFSGSGATYTATLTPPDDATGSITLSVAAGVAVDDASNDNTAADDKVVNYNTDNTSPSVELLLDKESITEDGGVATVTARLDRASSAVTTVTVTVTPVAPAVAGDYTLSGSTLMIAAGSMASTGTVTITGVNNDADAPDKTLMVSGVVRNDIGVLAPASKMLTLTDTDTIPSFGSATIANQSYTQNKEITQLTLPAATGGDGTLTYSLSPDAPAGLTFDGDNRTLSGTPTGLQDATEYTYTVTDKDGDTANLTFSITVMVDNTIAIASQNALDQVNKLLLPDVLHNTIGHHLEVFTSRFDATGPMGRVDSPVSMEPEEMANTIATAVFGYGRELASGTFDWQRALDGRSFSFSASAINGSVGKSHGGMDDQGSGLFSTLSFWGSTGYSSFSRKVDHSDLQADADGDTFMVHIGADVQPIPELITGFALSFSRSQVDWDGKDEIDGTHTVHFTTAHPYASWSADRWQVWMSGLFGSGDTKWDPEDDGSIGESGSVSGIVGGARFRFWSSAAEEYPLILSLKLDGASVSFLGVDAQQARLSIEAIRQFPVQSGELTGAASLGLRIRDDSTYGTGSAVEVGANTTWHGERLTLDGYGRFLFSVGEQEWREWGIGGSLFYSPGSNGEGVIVSVEPSIGVTRSRQAELWSFTDSDLALGSGQEEVEPRLRAELAYGLRRGAVLLTPYTELSITPSSNVYGIGVRYDLGSDVTLDLHGSHTAPVRGEGENSLEVELNSQF